MHVVQLADYGGPYPGSFVPMLKAVAGEAHARGHTVEAVFTPVARGRPWLPELEAAVPVSFARSCSGSDLRTAIRATLGPGGSEVLLHSHFTAFDLPALRVARRHRRAAVFWHVHTRLEPAAWARATNAVKFGLLGRRVDRIVCVSPHIAAAVTRRLGPRRRIVTIPNAVNLARLEPATPARTAAAREQLGIDDSAKVLLHMGRLWELKGGDLLLEAVSRLRDRGINVVVLTVGGGDRARADAARLALEAVVHPIQPRDDVSTLYAAADVFVSCSRAEGMPYSLLEAAACGTGLLATDIPGQGELARAIPGAQVTTLDPGAIADALLALLSREDQDASTDAAGARDWVRRNADLADTARSLVDLYELVIRHDCAGELPATI